MCTEQRIGKTLATIRVDLALTQKEVAKAAQLKRRDISYVECGSRPTRVRDVVAIAEAMGYELLFVPTKKEIK